MSGLTIVRMTDMDDPTDATYYAKGHHDDEGFREALQGAADPRDESPQTWTIWRGYWRFLPNYVDDGVGCYVNARPGRGAFPVTVAER